ncbi:MAG TPA: hypothetical protein VH186_30550 [Chloroflexia bacterium]|nr:hypothetical protein [Chloroflexia bacterium]
MDDQPAPRRNRSKKTVIRASEIGAYVYCRRAWWFKRVAGFNPQGREEAFASGTAAHARHGRLVQRSQWQRKAALLLMLAGLILLLIVAVLLLRV